MRRLLTVFIWLLCLLTAEGKVVKITLPDSTQMVYTSSELESIDIASDGMMTITTYEGEVIDSIDADLATIEISDEPAVRETTEMTMTYADADLIIGKKRDMVRMSILYPSTDPDGQLVTLSGVIYVPKDIWEGEKKSKGIMLVNHFTITGNSECPTEGYVKLESMLMTSTSQPDYILVESDFYGFGATRRFPQAYLFGGTNAQASIDMLRAARSILTSKRINYGRRLFNIGYSAGAYDAVATMRLARDKYADLVQIDHTMVGAGPMSMGKMMDMVIENDTTEYSVSLPMVIYSFNENGHLGLDYGKVFQGELAEKLPKWFEDKKYNSMDLCDSIDCDIPSRMFTQEFLDGKNGDLQKIRNLMEEFDQTKGWEPNPEDRVFYFHCPQDNIVPIECGKMFVAFLEDNGYTTSRLGWLFTNPDLDVGLMTTMETPLLEHMVGAVSFSKQVHAIIRAWDKRDEE